jgi:hypothetical protein
MSRFLHPLYVILRLEESTEKTASVVDVPALKQRLWAQMKLAAASDPEGQALGLAKAARGIFQAIHISEPLQKAASAEETLRADVLAVSFATALVVDDAIEKQAESGSLSSRDAAELQRINAISALADLGRLAKLAAPSWLTHPATIGAGVGGLAGAGLGAWGDNEDRLRGAVAGGLGGMAVGGLAGAGVKAFQNAQTDENVAKTVQKAEQAHAGTKREWEVADRPLTSPAAKQEQEVTRQGQEAARQEALRKETQEAAERAEGVRRAAQFDAAKKMHERTKLELRNVAAGRREQARSITDSVDYQNLATKPALTPDEKNRLGNFNAAIDAHNQYASSFDDLLDLFASHEQPHLDAIMTGNLKALPPEIETVLTQPEHQKAVQAAQQRALATLGIGT